MDLVFNSQLTLNPILATTTEALIQEINRFGKDHILHIRLDQLTDFNPACISQIKQISTDKTLLVSFRSLKSGGKVNITKEEWKLVIEQILQAGFAYVEIEMPAVMDVDLSLKHVGTKLVVCYASTAQTPGYRNLRKLQKRMRGFNPDIQAFDTKIKTKDNLQDLVRLLVSKKKSDNLWINFAGREISEKNIGNLFVG
jgi:3-dehydroquinate dehydratase type I